LHARFWPPASVSLGPCNFRRRVKARVFPWFAPLPISVLAHARSPVRCPTPRFVFHRAPGLGLHRFSCAQGSPLVSLVPHLSGLPLSDLVLPFPISAAERRPAPGPRAPVCSSVFSGQGAPAGFRCQRFSFSCPRCSAPGVAVFCPFSMCAEKRRSQGLFH
jgi:hypothetical protein